MKERNKLLGHPVYYMYKLSVKHKVPSDEIILAHTGLALHCIVSVPTIKGPTKLQCLFGGLREQYYYMHFPYIKCEYC